MEHKFEIMGDSEPWYLYVHPRLVAHERNAQELVEQKWRTIVEFLESNPDVYPRNFDSGGADTCAFCKSYLHPVGVPCCTGCPVYARTGHTGCDASPYAQWRGATNHNEALEAARAELEFVESLREEAE